MHLFVKYLMLFSKRLMFLNILICRSEGFPGTGYFFPAHGGWGNDNSEKFFSARRRRRRRRPLEGVPGEYTQYMHKMTIFMHIYA